VSGLQLRVYDALNTTLMGYITQGSEAEFVDEFNAPGFGRVSVPLGSPDAALLTKDAVVRVFYEDSPRFAWFVESLERVVVGGDVAMLKVSGRGLLAWLDDAVVYPQGGLRELSSEERPFNYASEDGTWRNAVDWSAPQTLAWKTDAKDRVTVRARLPKGWPDPNAQWMWKTDPKDPVEKGTRNWFRSTFTLSEKKKIRFFATADNIFELYLNGSLVMSSSKFSEQAPTYAQTATYTEELPAGTHTIGVFVKNETPWKRTDLRVSESDNKVSASGHGLAGGTKVKLTDVSKSGTGLSERQYWLRDVEEDSFKLAESSGGSAVNVSKDCEIDLQLVEDGLAGFLFTAVRVAGGKVTEDVVRRSNSNNWIVTDEKPRWYPAMILKTLVQEAATRGVYRLDGVTYSFTQSSPTSGSWSTGVDLTLRVGSSLLDVLNEMVDLGHDFHITPNTRSLGAWESRGTDLSDTIRFHPGHALLEFSTTAEPKLKTHALIRTRDSWAQKGVNVSTRGRREMYVEVGRTRSDSTAKTIATRVLNRTGKNRIIASRMEAVPVEGLRPYVNFDVGDLVSVPSPTGSGFRRARILSLAMRDESGTAHYMPELEVLDA